MLKSIKMMAVVFTASLASVTHAFDCSKIPTYSDKASYANGDYVRNDHNAYRCEVSGWCSHGGPYAPGEGWAASEAWTQIGTCSDDSADAVDSGSGSAHSAHGNSAAIASDAKNAFCAADDWDSHTDYTEGSHVHYDGKIYKAKWWTQGDSPRQNAASWQAWSRVETCEESDDAATGVEVASNSRQ